MGKEKKILDVRKKQSRFWQHFGQGLTILMVIILSILFYFLLLRMNTISSYVGKIVGILEPIIYGFAIAYLLNPIVNAIEKPLKKFLVKRMKNQKRAGSISRGVGILSAIVIAIAAIVTLGFMLLPELYLNIRRLVFSLPRELNSFMDWFSSIQATDSGIGEVFREILEQASIYLENWLKGDLLSQVNVMMSSLTAGVIGFFKTIFYFLIGLIVSVYVLASKEVFAGQCKKITYAVLGAEKGNFFIHIVRKSHEIFGGFISGKILDSLIIGIICFIGLTILDMPYAVLISVIIGVTNVIPFFGPYIGAIPSTLLIALFNPIQGVYFVIFILVLQQVDGNIIGPKILGDTTGVSPFWIIFSILLGGGLFGFVGMVIGVPAIGVVFYIIKLFVERKLEERKLPTGTGVYKELDYVDAKSKELVYDETDGKKTKEKAVRKNVKKETEEDKGDKGR